MFDFINFIKSFRDQKGLTQKELAELVGTHPMTIQKVESGDIDLKDGALRVLETINRLPTDTLLIHKRLNAMEREHINLNQLVEPRILMHHGVKGYGITTSDGMIAAEDKKKYKESKKKDGQVQAAYLTREEMEILNLYRESKYSELAILAIKKSEEKK